MLRRDSGVWVEVWELPTARHVPKRMYQKGEEPQAPVAEFPDPSRRHGRGQMEQISTIGLDLLIRFVFETTCGFSEQTWTNRSQLRGEGVNQIRAPGGESQRRRVCNTRQKELLGRIFGNPA